MEAPENLFKRLTDGWIALEQRDAQSPVIEGYGAVFYREGDAGTEYDVFGDGSLVERIMPGAFDRAVREDDVRSFFNHDPNLILGRRRPGAEDNTLEISTNERGLFYRVTPPATRQDVIEAVARGDVNGSSFMFVPQRVTWIEEEDRWIRQIEQVQLWEVGPVAFPAYEATSSELRQAYAEQIRAEFERIRSERQRRRESLRRRVAARLRAIEVAEG